MSVLVVGISHKTAPLSVLERVALDSEGRRLLTAEYPGGQAVWAIGEEPFAQLAAGPGWLSAAAVDPREDLIAIGTQAGSVRLAKLSSGETLLRSRAGEGRVVARYLVDNPNGSLRDIAGISNKRGNVVGLMPHPEHAVEELTGSGTDGLGFFTSLAAAVLS